MIVKITGPTRPQAIAAILEQICQNGGIEFFTGVSLYLSPRDADGKLLQFVDDNGEPIETFRYQEPVRQIPPRRPARKKSKPKLKVVGS